MRAMLLAASLCTIAGRRGLQTAAPPTPPAAKHSRWCCPTSVSRANTHMLMQDDNSLDIADILIDWIGKHVTTVE